MSISVYGPRAEYIGTGVLAEYTFDFKITKLADLKIRVTDSSFALQYEIDGNDTTYLSGVDFDTINGGGTITLLTDLPLDYNLTITQANDEPTQDYEFRNKADFTLRRLESAYDALEVQIQRLAYLAQRSIRLGDDLVDAQPFDMRLPVVSTNQGVQDNVGKAVLVGADNKSFTLGSAPVFYIAVQPAGVTPLSPFNGSTAFTSAYVLAVYNGTSWVKASDGSTPVVF